MARVEIGLRSYMMIFLKILTIKATASHLASMIRISSSRSMAADLFAAYRKATARAKETLSYPTTSEKKMLALSNMPWTWTSDSLVSQTKQNKHTKSDALPLISVPLFHDAVPINKGTHASKLTDDVSLQMLHLR